MSSRLLKAVFRGVGLAMAVTALKWLAYRLEAPAGECRETAKLPCPTDH
jgi:hypothetical protein